MGHVGMRRRVGRQQAGFDEAFTGIASFLDQFPLSRRKRRRILRLDTPTRQLYKGSLQAVTVLSNQHDFALLGQGYDVDPSGIFEDVIRRNSPTIGHATGIGP